MAPRFRRSLAIQALSVVLTVCGTSLFLPTAVKSQLSINKGAQTYCFMRSNGNSHEVSWMAAYALIKRQKSSLFKTSPEHGAVIITEAVVQNPDAFPDCGRYLGDLFKAGKTSTGTANQSIQTQPRYGSPHAESGAMTRYERYYN